MWYISEKYNRRVAEKLEAKKALWLEENKGGKAVKFHTPAKYLGPLKNGEEFEGMVLAYASSAKPIFNYGLIEIVLDGKVICSVTRKDDALRIMHALKRDYEDVVVRIKDDKQSSSR